MNKYINWGIYGLLILSFWALLSIGIQFIPLIHISGVSQKACTQINNVFLNLAYSYFAGFVMFTLTVTIPQYKRKMVNMPLIKKMISDYYSSILMDYFMFCVENKSITLNESNESFMKSYRSRMNIQFGESMFKSLVERRTDSDRYKSILSLRQADTNFMSRIIPFEDYLTIEQVLILNKIRQHEISFFIDSYEDLMGISEIDNLIFKALDEHINLAKQLKDAL